MNEKLKRLLFNIYFPFIFAIALVSVFVIIEVLIVLYQMYVE